MRKILFLLTSVLFAFSCKKSDNLQDMNNVEMPEFETLDDNKNSNDTLKIVVFGNSITSHPILPEIGWNHKAGMAATSIDKDYLHLLFNKISSATDKKIILKYSNFASFERNPKAFDINNSILAKLRSFNPDVIIYQLGDNVDSKNSDSFQNKSIDLLKSFKSKSFIVSPFFSKKYNFKFSKNIAERTSSTFIDISDISNDPLNKASSEKIDEGWKSDGIKVHPGNNGMKNISDAIFNALRPSLTHQ